MIIVESNSKFLSQKKYIVESVLNSWSSTRFKFNLNEEAQDYIIYSSTKKHKIEVRDIVFNTSEDFYGTPKLIPKEIVSANINLNFGILHELDLKIFKPIENNISLEKEILEIDVFGTMFILLTQYEDWVSENKDIHGRLKELESVSYELGNSQIPVLNYYLRILFQYLNYKLGMNIELIQPNRFILSLDIDHPSSLNLRFQRLLKILLKDLLIYKDYKAFISRTFSILFRTFKYDPYNPTKFLNKIVGSFNTELVLFFLSTNGKISKYDEYYSWNSKFIEEYLNFCRTKEIPIGYHPSYNTGTDLKVFEKEIDQFKNQITKTQSKFSGWVRHHYLRYNPNYSWKKMDENNYTYDSSVGFNSTIGFKTGICLPYPVFDLNSRTALSLFEYPISIMDRSFIKHKIDSKHVIKITNEIKENKGLMIYVAHNCELGYIRNQEVLRNIMSLYYDEENS